MVRRRGKVDLNQKRIVQALRQAGRSVFVASDVGGGFPDLVVGFQDRTYLLEVKQSPKHKLTEEQINFFANWKGGNLHVITSIEDALKVTAK